MWQGISAILTYAVAVDISPLAISAVILMLFSRRARTNGPLFLLGWALALTILFGVAYVLADQGNVATSGGASDAVAWGKIVVGVLFLLLAARQYRSRPAPGAEPEMPKWMAGIDAFTSVKAFGIGLLMAGLSPVHLLLTISAAVALAQLGLSTGDAVGSTIVFVVVASLTIAGPVVYYLFGGRPRRPPSTRSRAGSSCITQP